MPSVCSRPADLVRAGVRSCRLVHDAADGGSGEQVAEKLEFGGTRLRVVGCHRPHRAVVKVNLEGVIILLAAVREVALCIQQLSECGDPFGVVLSSEFVSSVFDEAEPASFKDSIDEFSVFFFDVSEQFDRQVAMRCCEGCLSQVGGAITIGWSAGLTTVWACGDETRRTQCP